MTLALARLPVTPQAFAEEPQVSLSSVAPFTAGVEVEGDQAYIYVNNGGNKTRIISESVKILDSRYASQVEISPDGKKLVFVTLSKPDSNEIAIWRADTDGSERQVLATMPAERFWTAPFAWSNDSTQLAYVLLSPEKKIELWKMQADGSNQEKVIDQNDSFRPEIFFGKDGKAVEWAADGKYIRYTDRTSDPNQQYFINLENKTITSVPVSARTTGEHERLEVPVFSQGDPQWGGDGIGCGTTMKSQGCTVTSVAMVFKYYGVDTNPKAMNDCLGTRACPLDWSGAVSACSQGKVSGGQIQKFDFGPLQDALKNGKPVIVGLSVNTAANHFVVVTGGSGTDPAGYVVNDPWDATTTKNLKHFIDILGWPDQMNIFEGTPPTTYAPGQNSSRQASMAEAFNRDGGNAAFGKTKNGAHWWFGAVIQDFSGDVAAIMQDEEREKQDKLKPGTCQAFSLHRGLFDWYAANGNPSVFGAATSEEYSVDGKPQQSFSKGYIRLGEQPGFTPWPASGSGWREEFFNNPTASCAPAWVNYEAELNFNYRWNGQSPYPALFKSGWSARFTRSEQFEGGTYTIRVQSGDNMKVWLDDRLLLDLTSKPDNIWNGDISQGQHTLKIEYRPDAGAQPFSFTLAKAETPAS
ncbi:MAG TPA: C39 family peptidase [Chloroflexia bacterium]|nr:C39 family peptidase [Chloroflexia bacterium]